MKQVTQTIFGADGNCLAACVASVFDLEIDEVPHFHGAEPTWFANLWNWGADRNLQPRCLPTDPGTLCVATGRGPRGYLHCVVWENGMVWDPHPTRAGLIAPPRDYLVWVQGNGRKL